ncbi:hypothetical protein LguiA_010220 [Lonicera macranthoides]
MSDSSRRSGGIRKSQRMKAPAKDFYAGDFVGDQWNVLKQPSMVDLGENSSDVMVSDERCKRIDLCDASGKDLADLRAMQELIANLRKENDNLLLAMKLQSEFCSGKNLIVDTSDVENVNNIQNVVDELIKTKQQNIQMRLYLDVLAEKVNKNESEKIGGSMIPVIEMNETALEFDEQFPPLEGSVLNQAIVQPVTRNWSNIVAPNRERASGADLQYVPPTEKDGLKVVCYKMREVEEGICRWKKAVIVYVLGAKPPFHVMKNFFRKIWDKFGEMKVFLLKTGVYVVEFRDLKTRLEVLEAGPWTFDNKPLIVKPWSIDVELAEFIYGLGSGLAKPDPLPSLKKEEEDENGAPILSAKRSESQVVVEEEVRSLIEAKL